MSAISRAALVAAVGIACWPAAQANAASDGCNQVNAGAFNRSGTGTQFVSSTLTFDAGEILTVSLTSSTSGIKGASDVTANADFIAQTGTSATASYAIPGTGPREFLITSGPSGSTSTTIVVTCVVGSGLRRSDLGAAANLLTSFVLNQIVTQNGQTISDSVNQSFSGSGGTQFAGSDGSMRFRLSLADLKRMSSPGRGEAPRQWAMAGAGDRAKHESARDSEQRAASAMPVPSARENFDDRRWNVWAAGNVFGVNVDRSGAAFDGRLYSVLAGVDYKIVQQFLVGVAGGWERYDLDTSFNGGTFKGTGYTVGPYLGLKITPSLVLDVWAGWTRVNYDLTSTATGALESGSFDANRYFVSANLTGHFAWEGFRITPRAGLLYASERQPEYTSSLGNRIAAQTVELGKLMLGPEIGYRFEIPSMRLVLEPYAFIRGEYDFARSGTIALGTAVVRPDRWGARAGGGLIASSQSGITLRIGASYDSIGRSEEQVIRGEARIGFRF